jgi:putative RecB family exonuclease
MPLPLPSTLTPSKISSFTTCALSFRFSVVERLPEPSSAPAVKGTLVHRALEILFSGWAPGERNRAAAEQALGRAWDDLSQGPELVGLGLDAGAEATFVQDAGVLLDRYFEIEDPNGVNAIGLELDLCTEVDGLVLRGIIDRLDRLPDGGLAVVDYKTGRAPRLEQSRSRLSSVQLYAYLCEKELGERPSVVRLMYLRDRVVVTADATDQSLRGVHQRARAVWQAIERACERSDFRPNPSALCKWCSFQAYCPVFGGDPDRAVELLEPAAAGAVQLDAASSGTGGVVTPLPVRVAVIAGRREHRAADTLPA